MLAIQGIPPLAWIPHVYHFFRLFSTSHPRCFRYCGYLHVASWSPPIIWTSRWLFVPLLSFGLSQFPGFFDFQYTLSQRFLSPFSSPIIVTQFNANATFGLAGSEDSLVLDTPLPPLAKPAFSAPPPVYLTGARAGVPTSVAARLLSRPSTHSPVCA